MPLKIIAKTIWFKIELWEDNSILRSVSEEVKKSEFKEYEKLATKMLKYIKNPKNGWIGLAAPQIWINKRVIAVTLIEDRDSDESRSMVMINPEILERSSETNVDNEWCLSLPWIKWPVARANSIKVKFLNDKGKENTLMLHMLASRIVLHEIDHLDGVLFIDKLET
jgi:peptide deformylase